MVLFQLLESQWDGKMNPAQACKATYIQRCGADASGVRVGFQGLVQPHNIASPYALL
jgi:hypothetical protein